MEKVILIGGEAGQGVATTSALIGKAFASCGYYVFNYRDYPSLIRGGHNFNILRVSDEPVSSHSEEFDVIVALDGKTVEMHKKGLKKGGVVLDFKGLKVAGGFSGVMQNNVLIGALWKVFGLPVEVVEKILEKEFGSKKDAIGKALKEGYNSVESVWDFKSLKGRNYFMTGNEAIGLGAIAAGLDIYLAYPMTPATPLLGFLAKRQKENNFLVCQLENEIGVANAALGASYAGAKVMVGTSGGGFALMTEAISLSGMSEVPLVVYLAQRTGPATGVPTYSSQGDLKFAVNAGHGEFVKIVVAPGDAREAFERVQEALYLSYKHRIPVILVGDKHLGESNYSFEEFGEVCAKLKPLQDVPGNSKVVKASSYEHDKDGNTVEDSESAKKGNDSRLGKMKDVEKEVAKLEPVSFYGSGKKLIIGWGSTKGAVVDALKELKGWRFMQVSYIEPFPSEVVRKEIEKAEDVVLVENNATGLLGQIIAEKTLCKIEKKILKYDARAFVAEDVVRGVRKVSKC